MLQIERYLLRFAATARARCSGLSWIIITPILIGAGLETTGGRGRSGSRFANSKAVRSRGLLRRKSNRGLPRERAYSRSRTIRALGTRSRIPRRRCVIWR